MGGKEALRSCFDNGEGARKVRLKLGVLGRDKSRRNMLWEET